MTTLLFPSESYNLKSVEPDFAAERTAAEACGLDTLLIDVDEMSSAAPQNEEDGLYDQSGRWWTIELGDGQISALPDGQDPKIFYRKLKQMLEQSA